MTASHLRRIPPRFKLLASRAVLLNDPGMGEHDGLLAQLKSGSESAWDDAFRLLYPLAFAAARTPLAGLTDAQCEDAAIEALTQLVPQIGSVKSWEELRALTATIAARRAISERRRLTAEKRGSGQTDSIEALREQTDGAFDAAELAATITPAELRELGALLHQALTELEPLTAELIREFVLESVPYKDLAQRHKIPVGTVGVQLARGLKKIRSLLEKKPTLLKEMKEYLRY